MCDPRWSEFEAAHAKYPGNGNPGKFVAWATEPFRMSNGGTYRYAIFQPFPQSGLVWAECMVDTFGDIAVCEGAWARSKGMFYDGMAGDGYTGNAIVDASAAAHEAKERIVALLKRFNCT